MSDEMDRLIKMVNDMPLLAVHAENEPKAMNIYQQIAEIMAEHGYTIAVYHDIERKEPPRLLGWKE